MVEDGERAARILRYWRAVELFSPQAVPRTTGHDKRVTDLGPDTAAPWTDPAYHYTVYGGLFPLSKVRDHLVGLFGDGGSHREPVGGLGALYALTIDGDGNVVEDSASLSSCAWAIGRTTSRRLKAEEWLQGFSGEEEQFARALNRLVRPSRSEDLYDAEAPTVATKLKDAGREGAKAAAQTGATLGVTLAAGQLLGAAAVIPGAGMGRVVEKLLESWGQPGTTGSPASGGDTAPGLTPARLHQLAERVAERLGVSEVLEPAGVRVERVRVDRREVGRPRVRAMLNSYVAADLNEVADAVREGRSGPALRSYLAEQPSPIDRRVDVRRRTDDVLAHVAPNRHPAGRWPTATSRPLVTSQQFAVNQIMADLGDDAGLFAVNGPPGTGKTTLLRDVIAAVVVERAARLAELRRPTDAFCQRIETVDVDRRYRAAVHAVRPEVTGFEIVVATATNNAAENITAEIPSMDAVDGWAEEAREADYFPDLASHLLRSPAWGLSAACLGSRRNRREFVARFWWGSPTVQGMEGRLEDAISNPDTNWPEAVRRFRTAAAEVARLRERRQAVADECARHRQAVARKAAAERAVQEAQTAIDRHGRAAADARSWLDQATARLERATRDYDDHQRHKPGFWVILSTFFRAGREWYARHEELRRDRDARQAELETIRSDLGAHQDAIRAAQTDRDRHRHACAAADDDIRTAHAAIQSASARWPGHVPFGALASGDELQLMAPWSDSEFSGARTRLFLEAMRLHKCFALAAGRRLKSNLTAIKAHLAGETTLTGQTCAAAWQSLFLVVPVVSTTFASVESLFHGLGEESLGWLLVDEAGQAAPQQAVGAIWRARRAVAVGDPLQLEPIESLPSKAQRALLAVGEVDERWLPTGSSVQSVADRRATYGTAIQRTWVGAPLRVHRRCDRPIFDISNEIAYDAMMIYGTGDRDDFPGGNCWFHVPSTRTNGHWVPDEGRQLVDLYGQLTAQGVVADEIFVISPFRDVASGARRLLASTDLAVDEQVGTVHTFQGREADVVVLVLGSDPARPGARRWAAERPNLLNVAVSRARRRLYVIGDRTSWEDLPHFRELATALLDDR